MFRNEFQINLTLGNHLVDLLLVHVLKTHVPVPCTERQARRGTNAEIWLLLSHHLHCQASILLLGEVPERPVGLRGPEIKNSQTLDIEVSATPIRLPAYGSTP